MSQTKLIEKLDEWFEVSIGRQAVGRIVHALADSPLGICYDRNRGVWYDEGASYDMGA